MRNTLSLLMVVSCMSCAANAQSLFGPEWIEQGDAGSLPGSAQSITTNGSVGRVRGALAGAGALDGNPDFEDMYRVTITVPTAFYIRTDPDSGGGANFNTQLWVFSADGFGILGNDEAPSGVGSAVYQYATDSTRAGIYEPGVYFLAISGFLNRPTSGGLDIFSFASISEISGPDGPGGANPIDGWTNSPNCQFGNYILSLEGVSGVPGPGTLAGMAGGLMLGQRSRRRKS